MNVLTKIFGAFKGNSHSNLDASLLSKSILESKADLQLTKDTENHYTPVYPPSDPGLPLISVEKIVASQSQLIEKIVRAASLDDEAWKYIPPLIEKFAAFVHLLPATKAEQYPGNGGLFRMGLDVGFHSLRASHGVIFASEIAEIRVKTIPRWRIATLVAGMLSDTYRVVTSMHVITESGAQWNPFVEPLMDCLKREGGQRYYIKWAQETKDNQAFNNLIVGAVVPRDLMAYLAQTGPQIIGAMLEAVTGSGNSPLCGAVRKTRQGLIRKDVLANPNFTGRPMLGSHLEAHVIDAMRRLLRDGKWSANDQGQPLWNATDGLYLIVQTGWRDIYDSLISAGFTGIPTDFSLIADILLKAGVILPDENGGYLHLIKLPSFQKKSMEAVRLSSGLKAFGDAYQGFHILQDQLCQVDASNQEEQSTKDNERLQQITALVSDAEVKNQVLIPKIINSDDSSIIIETTQSNILINKSKVKKVDYSDTPSLAPVVVPGKNGTLPPDMGEFLDSLVYHEDEIRKVDVSLSAKLSGTFNDIGWSRYSSKIEPEVASFLKAQILLVMENKSNFVINEDSIGFPASIIDESGLSRGKVINVMSRDGMIWIPSGQSRKLVQVEGVDHLFFNRRFMAEVIK